MRIVATAGHVDHGKSTLLRALTGMEPDRWEEERTRGLTIDLGFVWTELATPRGPETVAFVDVPGHHSFLPNMLAGAGASPAALLVVAADDGWSPQSQEHLEILDLLRVPLLLAVVTKTGPAGPARSEEVAADVRRRLHDVGAEQAPVVLADSPSGRGVDQVATTLAERLAAPSVPPVEQRGRLWVDRSFTVAGAGTVVTGTLQHAPVAVGEPVTLLPSGRTARVRGLQCLGEPVDTAGPGTRLAINLAGVSHDEVVRGDAVAVGRPPAWPTTGRFDARVRVLPGEEIGTRGAWQLHAGTAEVEARLHPVLAEPLTGEGDLRVELRRPLPLRSGDRFVLREVGRRRVVGGGEVLVPWVDGRLRGSAARLERAEELDAVAAARGNTRAAALVASGVERPADEVLVAVGLPTDEQVPGTLRLGDRLVPEAWLFEWTSAGLAHVRAAGSQGTERPALAAHLAAAGCPDALVDPVVDHLVDRGLVATSGPVLLDPAHREQWERQSSRRQALLLERLEAAPWSPPPLDEVVEDLGVTPAEVQHLTDVGELVVRGRHAFTRKALLEAVTRLTELERREGPFTAAAARDVLATTRRHAIPLLELLDARGITRFDGRLRQLERVPRT